MKNASTRPGTGLLLLLALVVIEPAGAPFVGRAAAAGLVSRVRFARGDTAATLRGAVVRGDSDVYILRGNIGQSMSVSIASIENNAVFQIKAPDGAELVDAQSGDDTMDWSGKLSRSGDYRIVVGGTRGNDVSAYSQYPISLQSVSDNADFRCTRSRQLLAQRRHRGRRQERPLCKHLSGHPTVLSSDLRGGVTPRSRTCRV